MNTVRAGILVAAAVGLLPVAGSMTPAPAVAQAAPDCGDPGVLDRTGSTWVLTADCTTTDTISIPDNVTTLDGNGNTITAIEETAGEWAGPVVEAIGGPDDVANVRDLTVTMDGIAERCLEPVDGLVGISFNGVSGSIRNSRVLNIRSGVDSGCQQGHAILVQDYDAGTQQPRNGDAEVTIQNTVLRTYQKTGILVFDVASVDIVNNAIRGDGKIDYIAQNGVQVSLGANARLRRNTIEDNFYTPDDFEAAGVIIDFDAGDVNIARSKKQRNTFKGNEVNVLRVAEPNDVTAANAKSGAETASDRGAAVSR